MSVLHLKNLMIRRLPLTIYLFLYILYMNQLCGKTFRLAGAVISEILAYDNGYKMQQVPQAHLYIFCFIFIWHIHV